MSRVFMTLLAISGSASLLSKPARVRMLLALTHSGSLAVTDLATAAQVSVATASTHLSKLADAGLVSSRREGRLRIFHISHNGVRPALDALAALGGPTGRGEGREAPDPNRLARTCYDHLAGSLGVGMTEALLRGRFISRREWSPRHARRGSYGITKKGGEFLRALGVDPRRVRAAPRSFAHPCLDRTERRPHVGGALGAALAQRALYLGWVSRSPGQRSLAVTPAGKAAFRRLLGLEV